MIRPAIVLALLIMAIVMMRGVAGDWRKNSLAPGGDAAKKAASSVEEGAPEPQTKAEKPVAGTGPLPDLRIGYLFNQERMLAGADIPPSENPDEAASENTLGISASIDEVIYTGSLIADAFSRALIAYPAAKKAAHAPPPASKSSRTSRTPASKAPAAASAPGTEEHAQLEVGDVLDGYEVAEILPDKIIFTKGDESVEKLLYNPDKKRQAPPPRPAALPPGGGAAGVGARPQQVTIGGDATASPPMGQGPATVQTGAQSIKAGGTTAPPPATRMVSSPVSPTPTLPPVYKSPTTSSSSTAETSSSTPVRVRRMVISRQPSPAPDTSKVIRQSSDSGAGMPSGLLPQGGD